MPIYEFLCAHCGESFEKTAAISQRDAKTKCPACGSPKTARKLSAVGVGKTPAPRSGPCSGCSHMGACGLN